MTARRPRPTQADHAEATATTVRRRPCPACGLEILTARTPDRVLAVDVRADPAPLDWDAEHAARRAGLLTWCLTGGPHTPQRLRWRDRAHTRHCTHQVVADHHCQPHTRPTYRQESFL
ncbi:hypothetical protein ACIPPM_21975 [Streptomyces sp. NPDC090119]|uniref:hypothetical protein n=1 Tax=Streptomyces sp. NPDC090119 TaxID=3365951 RepID=UPI0038118A6B